MTPWGCRGAGREPGCTAASRFFILLPWFQVWPRLVYRGDEDRLRLSPTWISRNIKCLFVEAARLELATSKSPRLKL
jgi:hypothetical protein